MGNAAKKYTRKQISEAIQYWRGQLVLEDLLSKISKVLAESANPLEDDNLPEDLREELSDIKSEKDLKKFMKKNSGKIKESYKKADKKSKPFYKRAWDCLSKAASSTAGFVLDHLGGILTLCAVLYAGHKIGFNNIIEFFTGKNPEARKRFDTEMEKYKKVQIDSIKAADMVRDKLPPEQQKEIFAIRRNLPDSESLDDNATFWNWLVNWNRSDTALADAAKKTNAANKEKYTSEIFMKDIGDALENGDQDKLNAIIDHGKEKAEQKLLKQKDDAELNIKKAAVSNAPFGGIISPFL